MVNEVAVIRPFSVYRFSPNVLSVLPVYSSSPFHNPTVLYESRFENLLRIIPFTRYTSRQTGTNIDKLLVRGNTSHVTTVAVLMCRMDL